MKTLRHYNNNQEEEGEEAAAEPEVEEEVRQKRTQLGTNTKSEQATVFYIHMYIQYLCYIRAHRHMHVPALVCVCECLRL